MRKTPAAQITAEEIELADRRTARPAVYSGRVTVELEVVVVAQDEESAKKAILGYVAARGAEGAEMRLQQVVTESQIQNARWTVEGCHPASPMILAKGLPKGSEWPEITRDFVGHAEKFVDRPAIRRPGQPEESRPVIWKEAGSHD